MEWFVPVAGSLFFWALFVPAFFIFMTWNIESRESVGFSSVVFLIVLLFLQFFSDLKPLTYIISNPLKSIVLFAVYTAIGTLYVRYYKWGSFVNQARRDRDAWIEEHPQHQTSLAAPALGYRSFPPKVSDYKQTIFGWIFYWPLSLAWTLLNDPLRRLYDAIYNAIGASLQRISDNAFK